MIPQGNIWRTLIVLAAVCLLSISFLGIAYSGMRMSTAGSMPGCPFMGETGICQMTPFEHIALWQSMFTSTPQPLALLALLLLAFLYTFVRSSKESALERMSRYWVAYRPFNDARLFNPLKLAFTRGI